jgi:uncharacterized membrane protein YidH (DUF202 family)
MNIMIGLALLALGVALLVFGFNEYHSFSSDVSRVFNGNPTNRSLWLIIGGGVAVFAGVIMVVRNRRG